MKRLLLVCIIIILGILGTAPTAGIGSAKPDSFLMIPWGSGIEQIGQEMRRQGFNDRLVFFQGNGIRYHVTFAGYPGYAVFSLRANQLYHGWVSGLCQTTDPAGNDGVNTCFTRVREVLIEKYGPPTREMNHDGVVTHSYWDWGKTGGSGDEENITILLSQHFAKGGATEGSVDVSYLNRSLEGRLIRLDR
ncbi:MAG: hypothetical protein H6Q65_951 [Firmicutes bacterium]|nr:hypothetical protein [Bacillota bacterium]